VGVEHCCGFDLRLGVWWREISLRSHVALGMSTALSFQHAASDRIAMARTSRGAWAWTAKSTAASIS